MAPEWVSLLHSGAIICLSVALFYAMKTTERLRRRVEQLEHSAETASPRRRGQKKS